MKKRPVIYQLLPRLFGNTREDCVPSGTIEQNGCGHMEDIDDAALRRIAGMGFTHVWYTGVIEHAHTADYSAIGIEPHAPGVVKGRAGSPYAITDYYDIDPDIAANPSRRMEAFEALVGRTHSHGLDVIIDFVPNHVSRLYRSDSAPAGVRDLGDGDDKGVFFAPGNNFYYLPGQTFAPSGVDLLGYRETPARATGNDCYTASPGVNDWYETVKLNYGLNPSDGLVHCDPVPDTWLKMRDIVRFWAAKGVDGMRCDMVHMVPLEFWEWLVPQIKAVHPGFLFIGEIYDASRYGEYIRRGGFDYLYDKVVLYDTLRAIQTAGRGADALTGAWQRTDGLGDNMLDFLENHDEQRYASTRYAGGASRAIPAMVVAATINRGAVMVYAGQELGERGADAEGFSGRDGRTTIFDYWSVDTLRRLRLGRLTKEELSLQDAYGRLLRLVNGSEAVREGGFYDLEYANYGRRGFDPRHHYAYLRHSSHEKLLIVVNFSTKASEISVRVPAEACAAAGLCPARRLPVETVYGTTLGPCAGLGPDRSLTASLGPESAVVLRLL